MLKDSLNKIRKRIGFTDTEIKILLFLTVVFFIGLGIRLLKAETDAKYINFNYSSTDSLFAAADSAAEVKDSVDKAVTEDYFIRHETYKAKSKIPLKEKSININKAGKEELMMLPGIGVKTAEKIIEYRDAKGKFKRVDELLEVKGIGGKKLEKIKKIIFIE